MKLLLIYHFGLFTCCIQWMVDEKELRVIHYTLGPLKPWDWWTSWLLKPVDVWQVLFFLLLRDNWKLYSIRGIDVCIPLWKSNMLWVLNFESHCHISYSSLKCFIANKTINEAEIGNLRPLPHGGGQTDTSKLFLPITDSSTKLCNYMSLVVGLRSNLIHSKE